MDCQVSPSLLGSIMSNPLHLTDVPVNASGDESIFPASTLSPRSDCDSSSDLTSLLWTARSASPTNLLEHNGISFCHFSPIGASVLASHTGGTRSTDLGNWRKDRNLAKAPSVNNKTSSKVQEKITSPWSKRCLAQQNNGTFAPITATSLHSQRALNPSPGISKMLLSLSDHALERPCTSNASTLYKNTRTHCNPSELGQQTYEECMFFTKWGNMFLQQSPDKVLITDLARDLGDGLTLLTLVEMLVREYPPQIHIKPALDVQKIENVQTCLNFLEHYHVSVNDIAAEDIVKGNLKVVLALCHCLYRHFASIKANSTVYHLEEKEDLELFDWASKLTGEQVTDFQSFENGTVLCLLLNRILENAVPDSVLEFCCPAEKINLVLEVSFEHLGIVTGLTTDDILHQRDRKEFLEYLKSLYLVSIRNTKMIQAGDVLEKSTLRKEMKMQQIREERFKDQHGSRLTYLKESSEKTSPFAKGRLHFSSVKPTSARLKMESLDRSSRQRHEEFSKTSPVVGSRVMVRSGTLSGTKRQLDELKKDLRLLQLEIGAQGCGREREWTDGPRQLSVQCITSSHLGESNRWRKPTNLRQGLRNSYRNSSTPINSAMSWTKIQEPVEKSELASVSFSSDQDDGKLPYGGCYLSETSGGSVDTERKNDLKDKSLDESFVFEGYQFEPMFLEDTKALTPPKSAETVATLQGKHSTEISFVGEMRSTPDNSTSHAASSHQIEVSPEPSMETKGISKLFDIDFSDLDATKMSHHRENRAVERTLTVGDKFKIDSRTRDTLKGVRYGAVGVNDESKESTMTPPARQRLNTVNTRRRHRLGHEPSADCDTANLKCRVTKSFCSYTDKYNRQSRDELPPSPPRSDLEKNISISSLTRYTPSSQPDYTKGTVEIASGTTNSTEEGKRLQRTFSNEKRHTKQILAKKSQRHAHPSLTKAHAHALTALIRMSAKNAGASFSEEDQ